MFRIRTLTVLALAAGLTTNAMAQTAWQRLAQKVAGNITDRNGEVQEQTSHASTATGEMQEVQDEDSRMVAALATEGGRPGVSASTGMTGLAQGVGKGSTLDLGLESEEDGTKFALNMFEIPEIRKLLGDEPRFVYNPANMPDPMLMPWVRNAAIYSELSKLAEEHLNREEFDQAIELYRKILAMNDDRYSLEIRSKLSQLASQKSNAVLAELQSQYVEVQVAELPHWVVDNTTGVIFTGDESNVCLVGEDFLKVGDTVPAYPDVKVIGIERRKVVYKIRDQDFAVDLKDEL